MKTFYTILILSISYFSHAQTQIPISSIDSGGNSVNNGALFMVYTIGEVAIAEVKNNNLELSEGFIGGFFNSSTALPCADSPENMISWWAGDNNTNDLYEKNNGNPQGGVSYTSGIVNSAFLFDGVDDVVVVPSSSDLDITGDVTVELWAKQTVFNLENTVICKGTLDKSFVFSMRFLGATFGCAFQDTNGANVELIGPSFEDFQWHHYVYVRKGNQHTIYADGFNFGWETFTNLPTSSIGLPLTIGGQYNDQNNNYNNFFGGSIDEVSVYNRALSEAEIQNIYNAGSDGKCKNTLSIVEVVDNESLIKLYPNPVKDVFTLDFENSLSFNSGNLKLQIFDLLGKPVKTINNIKAKGQVNISTLNSGIYVYKLSDNNVSLTGKIVKR